MPLPKLSLPADSRLASYNHGILSLKLEAEVLLLAVIEPFPSFIQVRGYPTIKYFDAGRKDWDSAEDYDGNFVYIHSHLRTHAHTNTCTLVSTVRLCY